MRVKLYINNGGFGAGYTEGVLHRLCRLNNIDLVDDAGQADILLVSMCDPSDLPLLIAARSDSNGQPVVMGGFESYFGVPYLAWADAVSVGEGFEFFRVLGCGGDWRNLSCVLTREKDATPSYLVDWSNLPVIKTGKRKAYYMAGRGCHNKCKFCATSWVQPYQVNNKRLLQKVSAQVNSKGCKVTFICNDSRDIPRSKAVNAASVTIRDYLKAPSVYKSGMLHFGVEGWTEQERKNYGKPITTESICELLECTKRQKQRVELFMIAGRSDWSLDVVREFVAQLPQDTYHLPTVHVKLTYYDPCPHTPLAQTEPATQYADIEKVFRIFNAHNKRFRVFPVRSLARSNWRTVLHRCTPEEAVLLGGEPTDTNTPQSRIAFLESLKTKGLDHLAGAIEFVPCSRIKTQYKLTK